MSVVFCTIRLGFDFGSGSENEILILRLGIAVLLAFAAPLAAKPLITSSEETLARVCLAREESPARVVAACDAALNDAGLTAAQRVELLVARGDGLSWMEHYDEAIDSYRMATDLNPDSVDGWNGLGWALWESDGYGAAYGAFRASMDVDVSLEGLAGQAGSGWRSGRLEPDEAREMLRAALAIDPDYIWAVREIAWILMDDRDFHAAGREFEAALEIDPDDINARYGLGRARMSTGENEAALEIFNGILVDAPGEFSTEVYRINALRNLDRNAQALRDADRLIAEYPDRPSGYIERGFALMALERRGEALETYRRAEEVLGPNNAVLYWYADALTTDGRFQDALDAIERGLALDGADYSDHLMKSYIALEMEDYSLARQAAEASLATGVEDAWAHYYIAITMIHGGETAEGLDRFDTAIGLGLPDHRVGAFAKVLIGAGKYVEAAQLRLKY